MADRGIHIRACPLCEAMCGLEVHHADGEVKLIRPNRSDVWSEVHMHAGVNNNRLAPPDFVDVPSGNAAVNGIPVEVAPA